MQSEIFRKQDESCNLWLRQNLTPKKIASVMTMLEQMVETKSWKASSGLAKCSKCRLCGQQKETIEHLLAGCKVLANSEYLNRHNNIDDIGNFMGKGIQFGRERHEVVQAKVVYNVYPGE